ncbi:MAG: FHA domain-containing protein [Anaerolinea sp.]|nr:FHA domain-containing protein [Anaerolinea sp.]MCC6975062.1 FHA domain-containing protein [Anaerolineae bacterium]CAG1012242.1 hypothetical protein ANRL4_04600 [Anaerolineae bacterium]
MIPITVTVQFVRAGAKESRQVRLSLDMTIQEALRTLLIQLDLSGEPEDYRLVRGKTPLENNLLKLHEASITEREILQVVSAIDPNATVMGRGAFGNILSRMGGKSSGEHLFLNAALQIHGGDRVFKLRHTRALIGRADPGLGYPPETLDVDLTPVDPARTVSRPHALIVFAEDGFSIRDLYSQLGVKVNGATIPTNQGCPLKNGDLITIGEVELIFRIS